MSGNILGGGGVSRGASVSDTAAAGAAGNYQYIDANSSGVDEYRQNMHMKWVSSLLLWQLLL